MSNLRDEFTPFFADMEPKKNGIKPAYKKDVVSSVPEFPQGKEFIPELEQPSVPSSETAQIEKQQQQQQQQQQVDSLLDVAPVSSPSITTKKGSLDFLKAHTKKYSPSPSDKIASEIDQQSLQEQVDTPDPKQGTLSKLVEQGALDVIPEFLKEGADVVVDFVSNPLSTVLGYKKGLRNYEANIEDIVPISTLSPEEYEAAQKLKKEQRARIKERAIQSFNEDIITSKFGKNAPSIVGFSFTNALEFMRDVTTGVVKHGPAAVFMGLRNKDMLAPIFTPKFVFDVIASQAQNKLASSDNMNSYPSTFSADDLAMLTGENIISDVLINLLYDHNHPVGADYDLLTEANIFAPVMNTINKETDEYFFKPLYRFFEIPEEEQDRFIKAATFGSTLFFEGGIWALGKRTIKGAGQLGGDAAGLMYKTAGKITPLMKALKNSSLSKQRIDPKVLNKIASSKKPNINDPKYTSQKQGPWDKTNRPPNTVTDEIDIRSSSTKLTLSEEMRLYADAAIGAATGQASLDALFEGSEFQEAYSLIGGLTGAMLGISGLYKGKYIPYAPIGDKVSAERLTNIIWKYSNLATFITLRKARQMKNLLLEEREVSPHVKGENINDITEEMTMPQEARSKIWASIGSADPSLESKANKYVPAAEMNAWLRFLGWSRKDILSMEKKAKEQYDTVLEESINEQEGIKKLQSMGLAKFNGDINYNFVKSDYAVATPEERDFMYQMGDFINSIDDPEYLSGLKNIAKKSEYLFEKLGRGFVAGADANAEEFDRVHFAITQIIHLDTLQNAQSALLAKGSLSQLGGIRKQDLFNKLAMYEDMIQKQSTIIQKNLSRFKFNKESDNSSHKVLMDLVDGFESKVQQDLKRQRALSKEVKKASKNWNKDADKNRQQVIVQASKNLKLDELNTIEASTQHGYDSYSFLFGRKGDDYPFWSTSDRSFPKQTGTEKNLDMSKKGTSRLSIHRDGKLAQVTKTSNDLYTKLYAQGESLYINADKLGEDVFRFLNNEGVLARGVGSILDTPPKSLLNLTLIQSLRKRGLQFQRKSTKDIDDYVDYLEDMGNDLDNFTAHKELSQSDFTTTGLYADALEDALIKYNKYTSNIPMKMNVQEWHGLTKHLNKRARIAFQGNNFEAYFNFTKNKDAIYDLIDDRNLFDYVFDEKLSANFIAEQKRIASEVKKDLNKASIYYKEEVLPFQNIMFRRMDNLKNGIGTTSPENIFEMFFTSKDADISLKRSQFDRMFTKKEKGKFVTDKEALKLLKTSFGYALNKGTITSSNLRQVEKYWGDLLGKDAQNIIESLIEGRMTIAHGLLKIDDVKKRTKVSEEFFTLLNDVESKRLNALGSSQSGQLGFRVPQDLTKQELSTALRKDPKEIGLLRENVVNSLFYNIKRTEAPQRYGPPDMALRFAMTNDPKADILKNIDGTIRDPAVAQRLKDILPDGVDDIKIDSMDEFIEQFGPNGRTPNEAMLTNLADFFVQNLTETSIKFVDSIDIRGAASLAAPRELFKTKRIIQLNKQYDLMSMEEKFKIAKPRLEKLYKALHGEELGKKHMQTLEEMMEINTVIHINKKSYSLAGFSTGYSLNMGMGRAYNVMKGVLSPRYALMEAGVMQMRLARQNLTTLMFTDPKAARIVADAFIRGKTDPYTLKKLNAIFAMAAGHDLSKDEKSHIKKGLEFTAKMIKASTQPKYKEIYGYPYEETSQKINAQPKRINPLLEGLRTQ